MSRDWSEAQFRKQVKAAGFRIEFLWLHDTSTGVSCGLVVNRRTRRPMFRESLARALAGRREREQEAIAAKRLLKELPAKVAALEPKPAKREPDACSRAIKRMFA